MSNSSDSVVFYTRLQRRLHWIVLLLVIAQYALQWSMKSALESIEHDQSLTFLEFLVTTLHTWGGLSIGAIMLWRWQLQRRTVPLAAGRLTPRRQTWVRLHHLSLYAVMLLMVLTGAMHYYAGVEWAARWHEWLKWLLLMLIGIHIAGAVLQLRSGDAVFQRMMGRDSLH